MLGSFNPYIDHFASACDQRQFDPDEGAAWR
jgi:hypothetical protein